MFFRMLWGKQMKCGFLENHVVVMNVNQSVFMLSLE